MKTRTGLIAGVAAALVAASSAKADCSFSAFSGGLLFGNGAIRAAWVAIGAPPCPPAWRNYGYGWVPPPRIVVSAPVCYVPPPEVVIYRPCPVWGVPPRPGYAPPRGRGHGGDDDRWDQRPPRSRVPERRSSESPPRGYSRDRHDRRR